MLNPMMERIEGILINWFPLLLFPSTQRLAQDENIHFIETRYRDNNNNINWIKPILIIYLLPPLFSLLSVVQSPTIKWMSCLIWWPNTPSHCIILVALLQKIGYQRNHSAFRYISTYLYILSTPLFERLNCSYSDRIATFTLENLFIV